MDNPLMITVASDEDCEACGFAVCVLVGTPTIFTDNLVGECAHCRRPIIFRPYIPKKPTKICWRCLLIMISATQQ